MEISLKMKCKSQILQTKFMTFPSNLVLFIVFPFTEWHHHKPETYLGCLCNTQAALSRHAYLIQDQVLLILTSITCFKLLSCLTESTTMALSHISYIHSCPPVSYPPRNWTNILMNKNLIMSPSSRKSFISFPLFLI